MKAAGQIVKIGANFISTRTDGHYPLTRQARSRGFASVLLSDPGQMRDANSWWYRYYDPEEYGRIKLADVRAALDTITLEDETAEVLVPLHGGSVGSNWQYWRDYWNGPEGFVFKLRADGRVAVKAPCGETLRYSVRTLDKALTTLGA
jgi:hypothetical protein